jgi:hypothetical protein
VVRGNQQGGMTGMAALAITAGLSLGVVGAAAGIMWLLGEQRELALVMVPFAALGVIAWIGDAYLGPPDGGAAAVGLMILIGAAAVVIWSCITWDDRHPPPA